MNDELSYEQEAELNEMLQAINARIEAATEEMRQRIVVEADQRERAQLERWWRVSVGCSHFGVLE